MKSLLQIHLHIPRNFSFILFSCYVTKYVYPTRSSEKEEDIDVMPMSILSIEYTNTYFSVVCACLGMLRN